jgi:hypothetical protein
VTASEFAFLALGLVLGSAAGAAIIEVLRARPPSPREVRVTMAPSSVPTRSATLAVDPFQPPLGGPAPGGPGDRRAADRPMPDADLEDLDPVPFIPRRTFVPVLATADAGALAAPIDIRPRTAVLLASPAVLLDPPSSPAGSAIRPETPATDIATVSEGPAVTILAASALSVDPGPVARAPLPADAASPEEAASPADAASPAAPCDALRAVAEDRCAVADRARATAEAALDGLRDAQRAYDEATRQADEADVLADPRAVRAGKEAAQHAFRDARARAVSRDDLEAAARAWLQEINRINGESREATRRSAAARAKANGLVTTIERMTSEADAARVAREMADEACVTARQAVADCEEAESLAAAAAIVAAPAITEPATRFPDDEPELSVVQAGDREARIMRLLRGDRSALERTVAELAGDDAGERRRWQIALTGLIDAIVAGAIDASLVDVPDEPAFWEPFTSVQRREIVAALASLGYRYDALGGFADGRVPSQRDLSLAVGYAGLDPMRIRRWPTEAEAGGLLAHVTVAADEYLVGAAGGMTLSELVDLLGRRADGLTDLWNDWGRVRGRLLATD